MGVPLRVTSQQYQSLYLKDHSPLFEGFERFCLGDSNTRRKSFNALLFLISLVSIVNFSQGLPDGVKDFSKNSLNPGQDLKRLEKQLRPHHLSRRIATVMVPVRERETASLCTYEVTTDINLHRIPDKIDRVLCRKDSCKCKEQGDYRCTQLFTQLNVTYLTPDYKFNYEFELIDVEYACVCSRALEGSNVNLLEPVIVK